MRLPLGLNGVAMVSAGHYFFVIGGFHEYDQVKTRFNTMYRCDTADGRLCQSITPMSQNRSGPGVAVLHGGDGAATAIVVCGGNQGADGSPGAHNGSGEDHLSFPSARCSSVTWCNGYVHTYVRIQYLVSTFTSFRPSHSLSQNLFSRIESRWLPVFLRAVRRRLRQLVRLPTDDTSENRLHLGSMGEEALCHRWIRDRPREHH